MEEKMKAKITPGFKLWPEVGPGSNSLHALSTALYSPIYSFLPGLLLTREGQLYLASRRCETMYKH